MLGSIKDTYISVLRMFFVFSPLGVGTLIFTSRSSPGVQINTTIQICAYFQVLRSNIKAFVHRVNLLRDISWTNITPQRGFVGIKQMLF